MYTWAYCDMQFSFGNCSTLYICVDRDIQFPLLRVTHLYQQISFAEGSASVLIVTYN